MHGQATAKRGSSDHKNLLVENLQSFISQLLIVDHMQSHNLELCNFLVSKSLLEHLKDTGKQYHEAQQEKVKTELISDKNLHY